MNKQLNISILKPCHEDWQKMTPSQQGKFCNACAKTVVDFTKKSAQEIQSFFIENKGKKVCGRFQKSQLDTITIEIPEQVLFQQVSFSRMFLLALLITMGATLMSCNNDGKKQKINQVIILDSVAKNEMINDSIISSKANNISENKKDSVIKETINIPPPPLVTNGEVAFGIVIETPPKFKESKAQNSSKIKEEFNKKMVEFINSKLDLKNIQKIVPAGKYKNYTQFKIDSLGKVTDIKTRAKYPIIESEINKVIAELPDFTPATQRHRPVKVKYTIPITFIVE
ncbi:hypothetical protein UMM65_11805 [Aureibaculum sp. 2210JD6-5]|uniref:hypothetical protein n=1 Tax=Aureibaculum sp. 2210JD6-5 TaxID=3103957 RepID=UPI002AAE1F7D|nr:hypothetical protein [Aureibaculum sp. 2210JD6-5]MDY7395932.1 hypothetical protein [Aureibaculum sp. 2210JD6-5]